MTKTETLIETTRQTIQDRIEQEYVMDGHINKMLVHETAFEEFEEAGGADAFSLDEDDREDEEEWVVDNLVAGLTINF